MNLLESLAHVDWQVAVKTFGSFHQTLIGLIVAWWNKIAESDYAIDAGPEIENRKCDALLCNDDGPAIILEVEGSDFNGIFDRMQVFLADREILGSVKAGMLVAYGVNIPVDQLIEQARQLSRATQKDIYMVIVSKRREDIDQGIRARNDYYKQKVSTVFGFLFHEGIDYRTVIFADGWEV